MRLVSSSTATTSFMLQCLGALAAFSFLFAHVPRSSLLFLLFFFWPLLRDE